MIEHRTYSDKKLKAPVDSDSIEQQVQAFLAKGGKINQIPTGQGGEGWTPIISPSTGMIAGQDGKMGIKGLCDLVNRSHSWVVKQIQLGKGPRFTLNAKGEKRFDRDESLAWYRSLK